MNGQGRDDKAATDARRPQGQEHAHVTNDHSTPKPNAARGDTLFLTPPILDTGPVQRSRVTRVLEAGFSQGAHPRLALAHAARVSRTIVNEMIQEGLVREATDGVLSPPPPTPPLTPAERAERARRNHAEAVLRDRHRMGLIPSAKLERELRRLCARTGA